MSLSDIKKTIRGAFIEEGPEDQKKEPTATTPKPATTTSVRTTFAPYVGHLPVTAPIASRVVQSDPDIVKRLEARIQASMPPAYAQFVQQYEALRDIIYDPDTLFRAALKSSRCSFEDLTQALDQLMTVLNGSAQEFTKGFEAKRTTSIEGIQKHIDEVSKGLADRATQIQALQQESEALSQQVIVLSGDLQKERARLEAIKLGFEVSFAEVKGRLDTQRQHLTQQKV